jgi:hypothetical protein
MRLPSQNRPSLRARLGASSTEYVLVLAVVVLPIALFVIPIATRMITTYAGRLFAMIRMPFG